MAEQAAQYRLEDIQVEEVSLVDRAANKRRFLVVKNAGASDAELVSDGRGGFVVRKAVWSTAYVNDLPDSAFLYIVPGGEKDGDGKTTPRSLRHFPVKDTNGALDLAHLRNALSRIPQANIPETEKERLTAEAERMLTNAQKDAGAGATTAEADKACGGGTPKRKEDETAKADGAEGAAAATTAQTTAAATTTAAAATTTATTEGAVDDDTLTVDPELVGKAAGLLTLVHKKAVKLAKPKMAKLRQLYMQLSDTLKELEPEVANGIFASAAQATTAALAPHFAAAHALSPKSGDTVAPAATKAADPVTTPAQTTTATAAAATTPNPTAEMAQVMVELADLRKMVTKSAADSDALRKENADLRGLISKQASALNAGLTVTPPRATPVEGSGAPGEQQVEWPLDMNRPTHRGAVTKARSFHG